MDPLPLQTKAICADLCAPQVFEQLYDGYSKKLYRYIFLQLSSKEDVEDVLATTFTKFWEYVSNPKHSTVEIQNIAALLYRIARNLVIDQYRARKPATSVEALAEAGIELADGKSSDIHKRAEMMLLLKAMEALTPQERDLLLLRFVEDRAVGEIAQLYTISENNASVRIYRALTKLKEIASEKPSK